MMKRDFDHSIHAVEFLKQTQVGVKLFKVNIT